MTGHQDEPDGRVLWRAVEVAWLFARIGGLAFGGPMLIHSVVFGEVVGRRRWLTEGEFLELMGVVSVLPGPTAVQMAMYVGQRRAGWLGFISAAIGFMVPPTLITMLVAALFMKFENTPVVGRVLYGVQPAVVSVAAWSTIQLLRKSKPVVAEWLLIIAAAGIAGGELMNEAALLLGAGAALVLLRRKSTLIRRVRAASRSDRMMVVLPGFGIFPVPSADAASWPFISAFLKTGMLLFSGGATLIAVLRAELVDGLHWLTESQLLQAMSVGQITPGPVLTTVTFIGYQLDGWLGALVATGLVAAPTCLLTLIVRPVRQALQSRPWLRDFVTGVAFAAVGEIAAVTFQLGHRAIVDPLTAGIAVASIIVITFRPAMVVPTLSVAALLGGLCRLLG
jgi:chromate transporter